MAHIVLDTRIIETSTGRYMQRLLEGLNDTYAAHDGHSYTALVPSAHVKKWQQRLSNIKVVAADQKWYTLSEQWSLYRQLRALKPDLVHFTMPQQPLLYRFPAVTTIHDMTLIRFDNIEPSDNYFVYKFKKQVYLALLRVVMRRAKAIITPTEFVRQDLAKFFGQKYLPKTHATLLAGEIPDVSPEPMPKFADSDYLFFIGNAFPYKNITRIIEAFELVKRDYPELKLLLAGKKDAFYDQLEAYVKQQSIRDVHFLGFVSDGEKRWLYQNAKAFVVASYSEGFCMPVLEAMIEGTPVISSNASCLPEVVGEAGMLFNPDSKEELAASITQVLNDQQLSQDLISAGRQHATSFSWPRMVSQVHDIYESHLGN